jgi:hypothetical protein
MLSYLAAISALGASPASAAPADRPPLQIWMNNDRRFREGERVRLQVDADVDGYLLVLNYDTDGRLRVLFPLDPRDDARVNAGRRYEVRDDGSDAAFRAGADGTGLIYSAIAREPWRLDDIVQGDRWDYTRLSIDRATENPEADITEVVQQLAGPGGFDYDVAGYRVYGTSTASYRDYSVRGPIYVYDDYLYCNDWYWRYNGCHRWPYDGGFSFGLGYYGYGSRYGYSNYPYYPYYPYRPSFPGSAGRRPVIAGRSRNYTVFPRSPAGTGRVGGVIGSSRGAGTVAPPVNWRPRSVARPVGGRRPDVSRDSRESRVIVPPARRANGAGARPDYPGARGRGGEDRGRGQVNPPARSEPRSREPSRRDPPQRSEPSRSSGGNGGGRASGGSGGGNGGSHAPSRPRRP